VTLLVALLQGARLEVDRNGESVLLGAAEVDRFAETYSQLPESGWYRSPVPVTPPGPGQQLAFEVSLDACTGCKACVVACHSMNGLDEGELWRQVGSLVTTTLDAAPNQTTVTAACHHCVDPACLNGCPVNAYEKQPDTGIVVHLDDQCIGCSYCTMTCPYEVPQYNERLGIVRKCDLCHGRLREGESPACVQGCPNNAIRVAVVDVATIRRESLRSALVPGAASSHITAPTTQYLGVNGSVAGRLEGTTEATRGAPRPAEAHTPLVVMLVLTQAAVGMSIAEAANRLFSSAYAPSRASAVAAAALAVLGVAASVMHLGRPTMAWKAFLGIRHSWLSREAVVLGLYTMLSTLLALFAYPAGSTLPFASSLATGALGTTAVCCSAMVYAVTKRPWWTRSRTIRQFGTCTVVLGALGFATCELSVRRMLSLPAILGVAVSCVSLWRDGRNRDRVPALKRSAALLRGELAAEVRTVWLAGCGVATSVAAAELANDGPLERWFVASAAVSALVMFASERSLFFRASSPDRMPGWQR
jgi:formate dehydrogenase iron-sulfur subunit